MKKNHIRNIAFIFFMLFITTIMPSCKEDDGSGYIFKMNIENNPQNLDPQMATDPESIMIITNMMEGLMKKDSNGAIIPAAAESFEMSDDELTYTFYLKQNQSWDSFADFSAEVTADDFVFAFERIFDAATESPYSGDYMCIKNAGAVLNGTKSQNELGVKAIDKYTVQFILEYPYYDFLNLLTQTAAMPCNRAFFEFTKGRYGMAADASASNGAFYLKEWNYDPYWDNNYIIMRRNKLYSNNSYVYPYGLNFFITGDNSNDSAVFAEGDVQCYVSEKYDKKTFDGNNYDEYHTKTVGLVFNLNSEYFKKRELREALAKSINREAYTASLQEGLITAFGIIPGGVTVQGRSYRDLYPDRSLSMYDIQAFNIWDGVLKSNGIASVDNIKITVPDSFSDKELMYNITGQWQEKLLFYCGVEIVSQTEYDSKIENMNYDIALIELEADENSVFDYLNYFCKSDLFKNYSNSKLISDINRIKTAVSLTEGVEKIKNAESDIINDYIFIPLCYESEYFVYSRDASDFVYYPFSSAVWFGDAKFFD
ncbi:MAG: peptide ABC transporter substrate-binding protein [Oscillospiraceae bacterium]